MTDGKLLKEIAKAKQITLQEIADAVGLTRQGLSKKIENRSEFRVSEVAKKIAGTVGTAEAKYFFCSVSSQNGNEAQGGR